jgi:hypothetical protein
MKATPLMSGWLVKSSLGSLHREKPVRIFGQPTFSRALPPRDAPGRSSLP